MPRFLVISLFFLVLVPGARGQTVAAAAPSLIAGTPFDPWTVCGRYVREAERALKVPDFLLRAISQVESGRWDKKRQAKSAWPWTVMAEGRGRYLISKAAAIAEVKALKAKGVKNIDVGCMQVNLYYHPKAFDTLEEAFDPAQNVAYAAALLTKLKRENHSWTKAVGLYHSATPRFNGPYRKKVFQAWRKAQRAAAEDRRLAAREARDTGNGKPRQLVIGRAGQGLPLVFRGRPKRR